MPPPQPRHGHPLRNNSALASYGQTRFETARETGDALVVPCFAPREKIPGTFYFYTASHGVYGVPRIFLDLHEAGKTCSKYRVARMTQANYIKALHGYHAPRYARGVSALFTPNTLQRGFTVHRPTHAWVTDITDVRTWEGWLYLAVVMDWHSRRIVGWSTKPTLAPIPRSSEAPSNVYAISAEDLR